MLNHLEVHIWGRKAGTLVSTRKGYSSQVCFYFNPDFVADGADIAPLVAPIGGIVARTGLPLYPASDRIFGGLPSFIADSLPDHWGNAVFREWTRSHGIREKELNQLDRLAYIGRRGMGALEFVPPASKDLEEPFRVKIRELADFAQSVLKEAKNFHAVMTPELAIENLFRIGTSAGGRRPKAVINLNRETGECYSGQVAAPEPGFTPMIIKFDEHMDVPTTRIEYSYYLMAREAGLIMMDSALIEGSDGAHFITERFDRQGGEKIHVQTLAAMNPLATSYEDLFDVAIRLGIPPEEMEQLFLLTVMNVLGGNVDDHTKNFSFLMAEGGRWHIAPAYDFTFTIDTDAPFYVNRHSISVNGKIQGIGREDLIAVGRRFNIKAAASLIRKVAGIVARYDEFGTEAGVPRPVIEAIAAEISAD